MQNEEIQLKVNAIHRMKIVILDIGPDDTVNKLCPYLDHLIQTEDDEILFAIAEELGKVYTLVHDKTTFLPLLEKLAMQAETVVREQASTSLNLICKSLSDDQVQNVYSQLVLRLANGEWFHSRQSSVHLFEHCYQRSGHQKDKLRKKFIELCNEDQQMIRRTCASKIGTYATVLDRQQVL